MSLQDQHGRSRFVTARYGFARHGNRPDRRLAVSRTLLMAWCCVWLVAAGVGSLSSSMAGSGSFDSADVDSDQDEIAISDFDRQHWSFRPIVRPAAPDTNAPARGSNPIDQFIDHRLSEAGLSALGMADRHVLIRRATFDLLGRPPTVSEIETFVNSKDPDAYERLIDRLLASPEYGIRWGQHWLDLARFAETDGFEHDKIRPDAWRYRDWVIDALNADLSYDQFIQWQIAGDELEDELGASAVATGFCFAGPDMPDINSMEERTHHLLNELTATVGDAILALQVGCAQCHDHMYDPISQEDFYRLRSFFEPGMKLRKNESVSFYQNEVVGETVSYLMIRGDWQRKGDVVSPDVPRVLEWNDSPVHQRGGEIAAEGRRTILAEWLVDRNNPLTARVIVNRVWQYHFGEGLVRSPSDFGVMGDLPDHPQLLDWLASELIEEEWSLKALHRVIVTSDAYRRQSRVEDRIDESARTAFAALMEADPDNRLLGRFSRRRLEGEAIRDAMILVAGRTQGQMGGPGIRPPLPPELTSTLLNNQWEVTPQVDQHYRRSVYIFARRNLTFPIFEIFDRPSANLPCARRNRSTTSVQSLTLLNSELSNELARHWANRLIHASDDDRERIRLAFAQAFARDPSASESQWILEYLAVFREWASESDDTHTNLNTKPDSWKHMAWQEICLALFNTNEFVYID